MEHSIERFRRLAALGARSDDELLAQLEATPWPASGASPDRYALHDPVPDTGDQVWTATDRMFDRPVVFRRPRGDAEVFVRRSRALARLLYPGIAPVLDLGHDDIGPWCARSPEIGAPLSADTPPGTALDALRRAAITLALVHGQGLAHGDLTSEHIAVGPHGEVFVTGWEAAWATGESTATAARTDDVACLVRQALEALTREAGGRPLSREVARAFDRARDASGVADALARWIAGAHRREHADRAQEEGRSLLAEAAEARSAAEAELRVCRVALATLQDSADLADKAPLWRRRSVARDELAWSAVTRARGVTRLHAALAQVPDHAEAHGMLAEQAFQRHRAAVIAGDAVAMATAGEALATHDLDGTWAGYRSGVGVLSLDSAPSAAAISLTRIVAAARRSEARGEVHTGSTPIEALRLDTGPWSARITAPGRHPVVLPVYVSRPGDRSVEQPPVVLPREGALGADDVLVPRGPFLCGGGPSSLRAGPRREAHLDTFVVRRHPVTNAEWCAFFDDLVARGAPDEAAARTPREHVVSGSAYRRGADGRHEVGDDPTGHRWSMSWPVTLVTWDDAAAFARWEARRTGRPWRLGSELEWEKAARGIDGRRYPWGDGFDPTFCCMLRSHAGRTSPRSVHATPLDLSPYGVLGMAGNMSTWCADAWHAGETRARPANARPAAAAARRVVRGGAWSAEEPQCRAMRRTGVTADVRHAWVGVRLFRDLQRDDL